MTILRQKSSVTLFMSFLLYLPMSTLIYTPFEYTNKLNSDTLIDEQYDKEIVYTEGLEHSKTNSSGWNVSGALSATVLKGKVNGLARLKAKQ